VSILLAKSVDKQKAKEEEEWSWCAGLHCCHWALAVSLPCGHV